MKTILEIDETIAALDIRCDTTGTGVRNLSRYSTLATQPPQNSFEAIPSSIRDYILSKAKFTRLALGKSVVT